MKRLLLRVFVGSMMLVACGDKNLGPLLLDKPKVTPPGVCETEQTLPPISCGVGACAVTIPACTNGVLNVCRPNEPREEICNDLDDDCNGVVDDGCDDDRDGYCDAMMTVVGSPEVCRETELRDCDDDDAQRHPGRTEICDDEIDNDCNELADYLDFNGCTHITASFQDGDGIIYIPHGTTRVIRAELTPPTTELERTWSVTSALPDDQCSTDHVLMEDPEETDATTSRRVSIINDVSLLFCRYELTLHIGGIEADRIQLQMTNARPTVSAVDGAVLDGGTLRVVSAVGVNPLLRATVPDDDDAPVTIEWVGRDAGLLDCGNNPTCEGPQMRFTVVPPAGTYLFSLRTRDSFDTRSRTRNLRLEVRSCVWLREMGTGTGTGAALTRAFGDIYAAVDAARNRGGDVCIAGPGTFDLGMGLMLSDGVGINAAFATNSMPSDDTNTLRLGPGTSLTFEPGYTGQIRRVVIEGQAAGTLVDVEDASPHFHGVEFILPAGVQSRGLVVRSTLADPTVRLLSSVVTTAGVQTDATGIEVLGGIGTASLVWNGASTVAILNCRGTCRGIAGFGRADLLLTGSTVEVEAFTPGARALAIDAGELNGQRPTLEVRQLSRIRARTRAGNPGDDTIAINLSGTDGTSILDNNVIGATGQVAGRRLSAGIADGAVYRDGSFVAGASRNLLIAENTQINAGLGTFAWSNRTCNEPPEALEGPDVAAGILLVGTTTATIIENGTNATQDTGVYGGASTSVWDPDARVLPPSVPGVWTIDTRDVRLAHNEIRAGVLSTPEGCGPPVRPYVEAFRDGLGPYAMASAPSSGLVLESNGIVTGRRGSFNNVPTPDDVGARAIALSGGGSVRLVNNYVSVTRGVDLVGVYLHRARDVALWNNVIEVESVGGITGSVDKRALILDEVESRALTLVNNIIVVREDESATADPTALVERSSGAVRAIGRLENNIIFVESAERGAGGTYVRVEDGPRYTRENFTDFEARVAGQDNLILPPLFRSHRLEYRRSITRLSPRSPARDAGRTEGAPAVDRFENQRPAGAGIDIGHHEFQ